MARDHVAVALLRNIWVATAVLLGAQGKTNTHTSCWRDRTALGAHWAGFGWPCARSDAFGCANCVASCFPSWTVEEKFPADVHRLFACAEFRFTPWRGVSHPLLLRVPIQLRKTGDSGGNLIPSEPSRLICNLCLPVGKCLAWQITPN